MTKHEAVVISAYTGVLMCNFDDMHRYIEEKLGRPTFTHELSREQVQQEIKEKVRADFLTICESVQEGKDEV